MPEGSPVTGATETGSAVGPRVGVGARVGLESAGWGLGGAAGETADRVGALREAGGAAHVTARRAKMEAKARE